MKQNCWGNDTNCWGNEAKCVGEMPQIQSEISPDQTRPDETIRRDETRPEFNLADLILELAFLLASPDALEVIVVTHLLTY